MGNGIVVWLRCADVLCFPTVETRAKGKRATRKSTRKIAYASSTPKMRSIFLGTVCSMDKLAKNWFAENMGSFSSVLWTACIDMLHEFCILVALYFGQYEHLLGPIEEHPVFS
jgi:hypothetical protein